MTNDIKDCRRDFAEDIAFLKGVLTSDETSIENKVEAAAILWDLSEQAKQALEPFKKELRELAQEQGCRPGSKHKWTSMDKSVEASVVVPAQRLSLKKGVDMGSLSASPSFADFIEETTTYKVRRGCEASFESLSDDERDTWLDAISITNPTPRVSFTRTTITTDHKEA